MATKVELKGKILVVNPTITVGVNNLKKQVIHLHMTGEQNEFGDAKGPDQIWEINVLGEHIEKVSLTKQDEGKLGTATVFLNSKTVRGNAGVDIYIINATLFKFEHYVPRIQG